MANEPINYEAVLADIDARITKLQVTREGILELMAATGLTPGSGPGGKIAPDEFLKMSIPDATKKYLTMVRQKKDTQAIIDALESGGLPRSVYSTVYAVLRRREKQVGDIINMQGDWALAEWYPNYRRKSSDAMKEETELDLEEVAKEADKVAEEINAANKKSAKAS
jgi:hypothetical protein